MQHGFRKNHSTVHSAAQLVNYVGTKMDMGLPTLVAYIDFKKVFDCVQHDTLIEKLGMSYLGEGVVKWIKSYLRNRRQRVLANCTLSTFQHVTQGVPQGSVLGPQLYAIDLVHKLKHCNIVQYGDDTVLYTANPVFKRSITEMQKDFDLLSNWCDRNGICANTDKTKLMLFGRKKTIDELPDVNITLEGTPLQPVKSYKYLGVTLDGQLRFDKHVQQTINIVSGKLIQFRCMRSFLNEKAALLVYKNMFLPILEYGDVILSGITVENKKRLQTLKNKGLRCALQWDRYASMAELHKEAYLQNLKYRREVHLLNFMYDMAQNTKNLKKKRVRGVSTRSSKKKLMKIRRPRTEHFKKCMAYKGPKMWNALSEHLQHIENKASFKSKIKICG